MKQEQKQKISLILCMRSGINLRRIPSEETVRFPIKWQEQRITQLRSQSMDSISSNKVINSRRRQIGLIRTMKENQLYHIVKVDLEHMKSDRISRCRKCRTINDWIWWINLNESLILLISLLQLLLVQAFMRSIWMLLSQDMVALPGYEWIHAFHIISIHFRFYSYFLIHFYSFVHRKQIILLNNSSNNQWEEYRKGKITRIYQI